jgi:phage terminase large subunit
MWNDAIHVCEPFGIPKEWIKFRSMDWGSYHPYAVGWFAVDYDGRLYMYRELYGWGGKANVGTKETARQVAKKLLRPNRKVKKYHTPYWIMLVGIVQVQMDRQ